MLRTLMFFLMFLVVNSQGSQAPWDQDLCFLRCAYEGRKQAFHASTERPALVRRVVLYGRSVTLALFAGKQWGRKPVADVAGETRGCGTSSKCPLEDLSHIEALPN